MPRNRSVKSIILETIIIAVTVCLVGHLSVNFWERFIIQSELSELKQSLHILKKTLMNVGEAYDALHKEMSGLKFTKRNMLLNMISDCYKGTPDRQKLYDRQVNTVYNANYDTVNFPLKPANKTVHCPSKANEMNQADLNLPPKLSDDIKTEAQNFPSKADVATAKACCVVTKNAALQPSQVKFVTDTTTMTRYPLKSAAAGQSFHENKHKCSNSNKRYIYCDRNTCLRA